VAQKSNFVHDFANNAGRLSKKHQASRSLSAIAELVVHILYDYQALTLAISVQVQHFQGLIGPDSRTFKNEQKPAYIRLHRGSLLDL